MGTPKQKRERHRQKYFSFTVSGKTHYKCKVKVTRCKRCSRLTQYPPFCKAHTSQVYGVTVARSRIPGAGKGLFATRPFKANTPIAPIYGETVSSSELTRRYGTSTAPYGVEASGRFYDGACLRYIGHMSNSVFDVSGKSVAGRCNGTIAADRRGRPWLYSAKHIDAGEEVLTYYGQRYLLHGDASSHKTSPMW
jgi:hypothetical protein